MRAFCLALLVPFSMALHAAEIDHAGAIRGWDQQSLARGKEVYEMICVTCHGTPQREGTLPTARPFWKEPFKNGNDPLSLYRTLEKGFGQMPAWTFLTPQQRYDVIHYVREEFVLPHNPGAYFKVDEAYLAGLPKGSSIASEPVESATPPYLKMDFGPVLFWTLQVASNNIAYKGIAVRLDEGAGGISRGRAWMIYDHDTMRVAAAWTGTNFIDWRGIAFDGSHQTHASILGNKAFVNAAGPGWANPVTQRFDDERLIGRDGKRYGPLARDWAHYEGTYLYSNRVVIAYTVGQTKILESPGYEKGVFTRTLNVSNSTHDLLARIAPADTPVTLDSNDWATLFVTNGDTVLRIPKEATPLNLTIRLGSSAERLTEQASLKLEPFTHGGPSKWDPPLATRGKIGPEDGPFAVDELTFPPDASNPWHTWMRFGGFDFFPDGKSAAICTWNGDVWIVSGVEGDLAQLTWKRIAAGLFQPLGLKIVDGTIYVTCRDQIARLRDLNNDGEIDYIENFNNDHQVTEHFHEFAMGLQTDAEGNFYYAKSARHALPAIVPHHGTLLKVSKDGLHTEIVANGFRAANGVCVNDDGTFFVTDQEGHWTPKNRINWVHRGGFYGNMFGYHDRTSSADADMEQPVVWITNEMDRSPGELVRVTSSRWGALKGGLLNLSYGTGRIFFVPHEQIEGEMQGGVVQLPMPDFPTGLMRGRFHPGNGHLYGCGMYAWAGNRQDPGGFYRIRSTGQPAWLPLELHARTNALQIKFTDPLDPGSATQPGNYTIETWSLKRTANYGSQHLDLKRLRVAHATLESDGATVTLEVPDIRPTWCMAITANLQGTNHVAFTRTIHNTIHRLSP